MQNLNWPWVVLFLAQLGGGIALTIFGPPEAKEWGQALIVGAISQGVTAKMGPTKE